MDELTSEERQRIYEEEKARREGSQSPAPAARVLLSRNLLISALCIAMLLCGIGFLVYRAYRVHDLKQRLGEVIGRDQALMETVLKAENDAPHMSYREFLALCNRSIESRTDFIVELRGLYPEIDYAMKDRLIDYLNAENEFVRAKRDEYQKSMELISAVGLQMELVMNVPSSPYAWGFHNDRIGRSKQRVLEAAFEAEKSGDELLRVYERMAAKESSMAQEAQNAGLRFDLVCRRHAKRIRESVETTKKTVELAKRLR